MKRPRGQAEFTRALRVNQQPGSATAMGTICGAQLTLGKNRSVHVVWDGMGKAAARINIGGEEVAPLLCTRLNHQRACFEPERNIIRLAPGLDGGSSVADDGESVLPEKFASPEPLGACACCGMRAFADNLGAVYIVFRAATDGMNRDALLLASKGPGDDFRLALRHQWTVTTCPMSSATLTHANDGDIAAWEIAGQVYWAKVNCVLQGKSPGSILWLFQTSAGKHSWSGLKGTACGAPITPRTPSSVLSHRVVRQDGFNYVIYKSTSKVHVLNCFLVIY